MGASAGVHKKYDYKTIPLHTSSFVQQKASFLLWGKNGLNDFRLAIFGDDSGDDKKRIWLWTNSVALVFSGACENSSFRFGAETDCVFFVWWFVGGRSKQLKKRNGSEQIALHLPFWASLKLIWNNMGQPGNREIWAGRFGIWSGPKTTDPNRAQQEMRNSHVAVSHFDQDGSALGSL